jgi:hypothetical protein
MQCAKVLVRICRYRPQNMKLFCVLGPVRPKAGGLVQHGGPPGWLEDSDPAGCDFVRDGRSMPPALTDHTTCPGLGRIYY